MTEVAEDALIRRVLRVSIKQEDAQGDGAAPTVCLSGVAQVCDAAHIAGHKGLQACVHPSPTHCKNK